MKSIALYVEGGGNTAAEHSQLRQGFDELLSAQKAAARQHRIHWKTVLCGGRDKAFQGFEAALKRRSADDVVLLLVDAEAPVANPSPQGRIDHLKRRDSSWTFPRIDANHVHLMTQCMEAWLVADPDKLEEFYGQKFNRNPLPRRLLLDEATKASLYRALEAATKNTKKGAYGKIRHASELLKRVRPNLVMERCASFRELTKCLDGLMEG
ncbi:MAG: DUF4276 family protein [Myxococcales bacterium]|jgi:hypothetical protein|nr:DUF4276 family protein [Myxococcales bacterium]